jgi:hypothetical protein
MHILAGESRSEEPRGQFVLIPSNFCTDCHCRKHRERKETYIKSLEQQVLQLLRQQTTVAAQKKAVQEENAMLKGLLEQHGIPIPGETFGYGPAAKVSVHEIPGGFQRLQVTMPEPAPDYFADFDHSHSPRPRETSSPESIDVDVPAYLSSGHSSAQRGVPSAPPPAFRTRLPSGSVQIHPLASPQTTTTTADGLSALPPSTSGQPIPHPDGLDAAQIGIDFVLALEHPCLSHTKNDLQSPESYGHILTTAAPLLTHAPQPIQPASSWSIPASEIERLLNLSSQLNLAGELTPVQAWSRIRSYPGFEKLNLDQLETLKQALLKEVQCYGYVARNFHRTITDRCATLVSEQSWTRVPLTRYCDNLFMDFDLLHSIWRDLGARDCSTEI